MKLFSVFIIPAALICTLSVSAAELKPYTKQQYDEALAAGKTVLVDFHASWCPTCRKQEAVLMELLKDASYNNVVALKADYDKEKELKKSLNVSKQSTLVVFKAGREVSRKTGITAKDEIKTLVDSGL